MESGSGIRIQSHTKNLYAAFDVFPGHKGAQAHIARNLESIRDFSGTVTLACLGYGDMPAYQEESGINIRRCLAMHPNFLKRSELFGEFLLDIADRLGPQPPEVVHFRDIWSGIPLLQHPVTSRAGIVFEVNALPSIELPYHYPGLRRQHSLTARIRQMEDICLSRADSIITVSGVTARYLEDRGVPGSKITLIPNMADMSPAADDRAGLQEVDDLIRSGHEIIAYAGVLTPWQGAGNLITAMGYLSHIENLVLVIAASNSKFMAPLEKIIDRSDISGKVRILTNLSPDAMAGIYRSARLTVAPLTRCDRNELQGCCPLKIVESMAAGTPVVASDLPVCRELIRHGHDGWLVTPDSARSLARGIADLLANPGLLFSLAGNAKATAEAGFSRGVFTERLKTVYDNLSRN